MRITQKALGVMIQEALEARAIPVVITHVDGAMRYEIEGVLLSPGEVAIKFDIAWRGRGL